MIIYELIHMNCQIPVLSLKISPGFKQSTISFLYQTKNERKKNGKCLFSLSQTIRHPFFQNELTFTIIWANLADNKLIIF